MKYKPLNILFGLVILFASLSTPVAAQEDNPV